MSTESSKEEQRDDETASQNDLETHEVHSSRINLFNCLFMRFAKQDEIDVGEQLQEDDEEIRPPQYKHLIAIHAGKPKGELENWFIINEKGVKRLSLSEQVLENAIRKCGKYITRFTQHNLLRVYPKATRIYSSNYDPFVGWTHGAQMVAFNMQGYGKHLQIMQGMFRANGGCGYVKKPKFLLSKEGFDPTVPLPVKKILVVKIYSGEGWHLDFPNTHFDPYSPPDFFVKVGIAGVDADKAKGETEAVENSWLPEWNEEFKFELTVPELAILMIEVLEKDKYGKHDFGGRTCFPISELRTGIRAVPLHDRRGVKYRNSRLLMKLNLYPSKDAVPEDVRILFQEYSQDGNMSIDGLHKFLNEYQGEKNATKEISRAIFISLKHFNIFRLEAFYQYLLSDLNTPLSPSCNARHDMTAPLAHYFLYTGHNWYLTENQTSSEGSVESIKKALQKGARVIELDLWPSKNNKVVVFHGRTLNGSAELLECLLAIKEFAFRTSEYPVVITFEDHLPADLQAMVGEMVTKTFGGMLFRPARDIPSPQSLKKKVLISTKPPKDDLETQNSKSPQKSKKSPKEEQWDDEKTASKTDLETYDKVHLE
ncbi:unnamed protein product [Dovyalis caffra]|uniref:Phosphoinositide phospholipase C n=1 Tax=Dovyalis caffra TaxID=77055 RepID=A0AAV1R9T1_9ROSI|nr:unnamed protein product [Dovyalis caffra]